MTATSSPIQQRYGYTRRGGAARPFCARRSRCRTSSVRRDAGATRQRRGAADAVPPYFSQAVITPRPDDGDACVRHPPDAARRAAARDRRHALARSPASGRARASRGPAGARGPGQRGAVARRWRRLLTLLVGLWRSRWSCWRSCAALERALVPLVPIALATRLVGADPVRRSGCPLNPMSVTLGALVIAISTEFSVLLSERYRQERAAGRRRRGARRTYRVDRRGRARLRVDRDRRLRRPGAVGHPHAARLRPGHRGRPHRLAARRAVVLPSVLVLAERGELTTLPAQSGARCAGRRAPAAARARPGVKDDGPLAFDEEERRREPAHGRGGAGSRGRPGLAARASPDATLRMAGRASSACAIAYVRSTCSAPRAARPRGAGGLAAASVRRAARGRSLNGDANVAAGPARARGQARRARSGAEVLNVCRPGRGVPLVLAFFITRARRVRARARYDAGVAARFRACSFAAVAVRGDRGDLRRRSAAAAGLPVGYDRDGAVANLYGVSVCPTIAFAYPGG